MCLIDLKQKYLIYVHHKAEATDTETTRRSTVFLFVLLMNRLAAAAAAAVEYEILTLLRIRSPHRKMNTGGQTSVWRGR